MTETQEQRIEGNGLDEKFNYCAHCGAEQTQLREVIQSETARQLGQYFGEPKGRGKEIFRDINFGNWTDILGGIAKATGLLIMINTIIPENYRVPVNIGAGVYVLGMVLRGLSQNFVHNIHYNSNKDIRERLKIPVEKED